MYTNLFYSYIKFCLRIGQNVETRFLSFHSSFQIFGSSPNTSKVQSVKQLGIHQSQKSSQNPNLVFILEMALIIQSSRKKANLGILLLYVGDTAIENKNG